MERLALGRSKRGATTSGMSAPSASAPVVLLAALPRPCSRRCGDALAIRRCKGLRFLSDISMGGRDNLTSPRGKEAATEAATVEAAPASITKAGERARPIPSHIYVPCVLYMS